MGRRRSTTTPRTRPSGTSLGSKQYNRATLAPTYMKDVRGKKGPDGGRNIGFGHDKPIGFIVPAGSLGLSVAVFTVCALTTIAVLYYRRVTIGAELGGPKSSAKRHAALLVGLWLVYIVASILSTEGMI